MEDATAKPYKGPESYQTHDAELFFGRSGAAEELTARVLSSRVTVLHAQSGAGKTSLINAMLIPGLELRGWTPFRVLPQNDPTLALQDATLTGLLPPVWAEERAVSRALLALSTAPEEELSINELLGRYDDLVSSDPRRRRLISPVRAETEPGAPAGATFAPHFCRVLRASLELQGFFDRLMAIEAEASVVPSPSLSSLRGDSSAREFLQLFRRPDFEEAHQTLYRRLNVTDGGLVPFFKNLTDIYGTRVEELKLVLVLDQFEEIFTRFVDPGPGERIDSPGLLDWHLRKRFFDELQGLLVWVSTSRVSDKHERAFTNGEPAAAPAASIRLVISLRDEYLAQLTQATFLAGTDRSAFHLQLLEVENARLAIQEPAQRFGYRYADDCYQQLIKELTKEERFVEPSHIQVVCEKLWNVQGQQIARAGEVAKDELPFVEKQTFDALRGTSGILSSYFREVLEQLVENERAEGLELLDSLVTSSGTRNIVERGQLEAEPFRDLKRRRHILEHFVNRSIVRIEPRLGGHFVEITHEFLIRPILSEIKSVLDKDIEYRSFRAALRNLRGLRGQSLSAGDGGRLRTTDLMVLHRRREEIVWDPWSIELMARNSLFDGLEKEMKFWLTRFSEGKALELSTVIDKVDRAENNSLTLEELRFLTLHKDSLNDLDTPQTRSILRSFLLHGQAHERNEVAHWAGRIAGHGT